MTSAQTPNFTLMKATRARMAANEVSDARP